MNAGDQALAAWLGRLQDASFSRAGRAHPWLAEVAWQGVADT